MHYLITTQMLMCKRAEGDLLRCCLSSVDSGREFRQVFGVTYSISVPRPVCGVYGAM